MILFIRCLETEDLIFFENNNLNMNHNKAEILNIPKNKMNLFGFLSRTKNMDEIMANMLKRKEK